MYMYIYNYTYISIYIYISIYFLCMHNTLVHAQLSCACTGGARDQTWDPKRPRPRAWDRPSCLFGSQAWSLAPAVHAQECCACTRVLCMHKNLVHAQESCACTRILTFLTILTFFDVFLISVL